MKNHDNNKHLEGDKMEGIIEIKGKEKEGIIEIKSNINELAEALSKAQSEIQDAEKNSKNPHFKSEYADLSAVLQATREPLSKNGLSVSQSVNSENDDYFLETTLLHKSGQSIKSKMKLILDKKTMQGLGGAITYGRRYALASIVGIAQEDSDGEPSRSEREVVAVPDNSVKNNFNSSHSSNHSINLEEYTYPFGKLKGRKFKDIGKIDLYNAHRWLCDTDKEKFKDLIFKIEEFLNTNKNEPSFDQSPIPEFDPNEQIPF